MELLDKATGKGVDIPDADAQAAFQSGKYGFDAGTRVPVTLADGRLGTVQAEELSSTLKAGGALASTGALEEARQAKAEQKLQAEHGGLGEMAKTYAEGAWRGASFGLSDPALIALGADREAMEARKRANPWTAGISEIGGTLAPMLIPGVGEAKVAGEAARAGEAGITAARAGAGVARAAESGAGVARAAEAGAGAARAGAIPAAVAGGIPGAVNFVGSLAESAVKAVVGKGSANTVARIVQKGVAAGARGSVEGALYAAGSQISEDTLGDHAITGEKLAAALGHGALMGGLFGAGMGAGFEGLSTGSRALVRVAAPAAKKAAAEEAVKALQYGGLAPAKLTKRMEALPGGTAGVGRELIESGAIKFGDKVETVAPRLEKMADENGQELTEILRTAGKELPRVKINDVISDYQKAVQAEFGDMPLSNASTLSHVDTLTKEFQLKFPEPMGGGNRSGQATLEELRDFRRKVDKQISWNPVAPGAKSNPTAEALKIVRAKIESSIETALDNGGEQLSGASLKTYQAKKLTYRRLISARDVAMDSITRAKKNQSVSLSEKAIAGVGMVHAIATGNPLALAGGLVGSAAHHMLQARGNSAAAILLDKVAELSAFGRTISAADARAEHAMARFMDGQPTDYEAVKITSKAERDAVYKAHVQRVKVAAADPVAHADAVSASLGGLAQHAPKAAAAAAATTARASVFLASKMPRTPPPRTIQPQFDNQEPSATEKETFLRYARAADDPYSVLDDMSRGRLTREGVETIKVVYPSILGELQQLAMRKAVDVKKPFTYDQKLQLGLLLDVPTDATLKPEFIAAMQRTFEQPGAQEPPGLARKPLDNFADASTLGKGRRS